MNTALPIFLFYVLPIWNVLVLLTVNRKTRYKNPILILSLLLNVAGLVMMYSSGVITDDKTHARAVRVFLFFILLELFLFIKWSRKAPKTITQNEDAQDQ